MRAAELELANVTVLPGVAPAHLADVDRDAWTRAAAAVREAGGRLIAVWGTERELPHGVAICAAYALDDGVLWLRLPLPVGAAAGYPDLSGIFACATRMQRAVHDLLGVRADGAADMRPWLAHGNWPADYHPLQKRCSGTERFESNEADYPFVGVAGDGVHEIAVGPIHAGIIEPGHFRFSVVGEKVLRLEERLGYAHKGIERLFERLPLFDGYRLAGRISGDTTVAFAWAYCMAVEQALGAQVPPRAQWLRALLLERERVANHLGDLGAIGNDAGFAFGLAHFSRLKEEWLRVNERIGGHRYLMDRIVPGGVAFDVDAQSASAIALQCDEVEQRVQNMQRIYEEQSGVQDRFAGTGIVAPRVAAHFDVCGLVARASGRLMDLRVDQPVSPYDRLEVRIASDRRGDVAARVAVRFSEIYESIRLLRAMLANLPDGSIAVPLQQSDGAAPSYGVGRVEGWRGEVFVAVETGVNGTIARCHCHDPSWQNWPALEHAIIGNIVPDFPLINKSFNLSYSGHDL